MHTAKSVPILYSLHIYIRNDIVVYKWFYEMSFVIYHDNAGIGTTKLFASNKHRNDIIIISSRAPLDRYIKYYII